MNEKEILEITLHNSHCEEMRFIQHPRNPDMVYYPQQVVEVKCDDGQWRPGVLYVSKGYQHHYVRRADQFEKFEVVYDQ